MVSFTSTCEAGVTSWSRADGRIIVLDLAGAVWFRPGRFWHRLFSSLIAWNHSNTLFKWKVLLAPRALSRDERTSLQRFPPPPAPVVLSTARAVATTSGRWTSPRLLKAPEAASDPEI